MGGICRVRLLRTTSGWSGRKGHIMTNDDELLADVRRQDEEAEREIAAQLAELRKTTPAIRHVDLGPDIQMWRVGYYKDNGQAYVVLETLEGPRDNPHVTSKVAVSIQDALLYARGIIEAVAKAVKE
jgi:hypothetical protein